MKIVKNIAKWALVGISVALAVLWAVPAQGVTDTHAVTFNNQSAISLTLTGGTVALGTISPATAATSSENAVNANVKSNSNWTLKVKGPTNFSDGGTNTIPVGRLSWASDNATWTAMTTSDATVATGSQTSESGTDTGMEYKVQLQWGDAIASGYSATITYTATNP